MNSLEVFITIDLTFLFEVQKSGRQFYKGIRTSVGFVEYLEAMVTFFTYIKDCP